MVQHLKLVTDDGAAPPPKKRVRRWKQGDIVALRSGGSAMTVAYDSENGLTKCVWDGEDGAHRDTFPSGVLQRYSEPRKPIK